MSSDPKFKANNSFKTLELAAGQSLAANFYSELQELFQTKCIGTPNHHQWWSIIGVAGIIDMYSKHSLIYFPQNICDKFSHNYYNHHEYHGKVFPV